MPVRFGFNVSFRAVPGVHRRWTACFRHPRVRAGATAAVVLLVPGAGVAWLVWQLVRRLRPVVASDA
jgi:hypothetical protein